MSSHILVIENESHWSDKFENVLIKMGYFVETAKDHEEARNLLKRSRYDLVLLDVCLTGNDITMDDQLFWEFLQKEYDDLPVVAITGQLLAAEDIWSYTRLYFADFVDFINKGKINLEEFRQSIRNALQNPSVGQPTRRADRNGEVHSMFTPEKQIAWLILQEAFTLVANELKQRWHMAREKPQPPEAAQDDPSQPGVSESLQTVLRVQLEDMQNVTKLEMVTDNLKTAMEMAKKYNRVRNKYRQELPLKVDPVPIEIQIEEAERKRDQAIKEIKTIFEELANEGVFITESHDKTEE